MVPSTHNKKSRPAFEVAITDSQLAMIVFTALKDTEQLDEECFDINPFIDPRLDSEEERRLIDLVSLIMSYPDMSQAIVCNHNTNIYASAILVEANTEDDGITDGITITPYLDSISEQGQITKQPTLIDKKISRNLLGESEMLAMQLTTYTMEVLRTVTYELTRLVDYYTETFDAGAQAPHNTESPKVELPVHGTKTVAQIRDELNTLISPVEQLDEQQTYTLDTLIDDIINTVRDSYTLAMSSDPRISNAAITNIDVTVNDAIGNNWF